LAASRPPFGLSRTMTQPFVHGVTVTISDNGAQPISVASTSVIGLIGTAPNADPTVFPLNTPVLVAGSQLKAASLTALSTGTDNGTLPDAVASIFSQSLAVIVVIRVAEGPTGYADPETLANILGGVNATNGQFEGMQGFLASQSITGVKPRILIAPGFTHQVSETGVDEIAFTPGAGYANGTYPLTITDSVGGTGSGAAATATIVGGVVASIAISNPGNGYGAPTATLPASAGVPTTAATFTLTVGVV
jgi:phage tail sheath protein FI